MCLVQGPTRFFGRPANRHYVLDVVGMVGMGLWQTSQKLTSSVVGCLLRLRLAPAALLVVLMLHF
jgi:hypothetical protein